MNYFLCKAPNGLYGLRVAARHQDVGTSAYVSLPAGVPGGSRLQDGSSPSSQFTHEIEWQPSRLVIGTPEPTGPTGPAGPTGGCMLAEHGSRGARQLAAEHASGVMLAGMLSRITPCN